MNEQLKERWIHALESGDFQQTQGHLRLGEGYCCLGVLYEIQGHEWIDTGQVVNGRPLYCTDGEFEDETGDRDPRLDVGTCDSAGRVGFKVHIARKYLMEMNDEGASFNEIARWIRENL